MKSSRYPVALAKALHPDDGLEPLPDHSPHLPEYLGRFVQQLSHFLLELCDECPAFRLRLFFEIQ